MTHTFEVVDAKRHHIGVILRKMRAGHVSALSRVGIDRREMHRQLTMMFTQSSFRRSWMVDGKLAAIGGVTGMLLSETGFIWLALTQDVLRFPRAVIVEARRQLAEIMSTRTELATTLIADDDVAIRFARFLGFHGDMDRKIPVGSGHAIAVGYHLWEHEQCASQPQP